MLKIYEILVPTEKNGGLGFYTTKFHRIWDQKVRAITNGLTIIQPIKGEWLDKNGNLY